MIKMKKLAGIILVCFSILHFSLLISLARISMHLDILIGSGFTRNIFDYVSAFEIISSLSVFVIGCVLIKSNIKDN